MGPLAVVRCASGRRPAGSARDRRRPPIGFQRAVEALVLAQRQGLRPMPRRSNQTPSGVTACSVHRPRRCRRDPLRQAIARNAARRCPCTVWVAPWEVEVAAALGQGKMAFEVHLPQLVRPQALEALEGGRRPSLPQGDAMAPQDRRHRQWRRYIRLSQIGQPASDLASTPARSPIAPPEPKPPSPSRAHGQRRQSGHSSFGRRSKVLSWNWSGVAAKGPTDPSGPIQHGPATCSPSCD